MFTIPAEVAGATDAYLSDQDLMAKWIADRAECDDGFVGPSVDLFADWAVYARQNSAEPGTQADFKEALERRGFAYGRVRANGKQVRGFKGIRLPDHTQATKVPVAPTTPGDEDNPIRRIDDLFRTGMEADDDV